MSPTATAARPKVVQNAPKLTKTGKTRAARTPSAFTMAQRLNVAYHSDVAGRFNLGALIEQAATDQNLAVRVVQRTRKIDPNKPRKNAPSGISNVSVYVAPHGYEFKAAAARGIRVSDAATADTLRNLAAQLNMSVDDVIRAALSKLAQQ